MTVLFHNVWHDSISVDAVLSLVLYPTHWNIEEVNFQFNGRGGVGGGGLIQYLVSNIVMSACRVPFQCV